VPSEVISHLGTSANVKKTYVTTSDGITQCDVVNSYTDTNLNWWIMWIKAPILSASSSNEFYLYYDTSTVDNPSHSSSHDVFNTLNDIIAYWKLDDTHTSSTADDLSIQNNTGTITNVENVIGVKGLRALRNGYFTVDNYTGGFPAYNPTGGYSISGWVSEDVGTGVGTIYREWHTSGSAMFEIKGTGKDAPLRVVITNDSGTVLLDKTGLTNLMQSGSSWHNIAWTDNNGSANLYIDGVADGQNFSYTPGTLTLNQTSVGFDFSGSVDEFTIYNAAKNASWLKVDAAKFRGSNNNALDITFSTPESANAIDYTNYGDKWILVDANESTSSLASLRIYDNNWSYEETITVPVNNIVNYGQFGSHSHTSSFYYVAPIGTSLEEVSYGGVSLSSLGVNLAGAGNNLGDIFVDTNNNILYAAERGAGLGMAKLRKIDLNNPGTNLASLSLDTVTSGDSRPRSVFFDNNNLFLQMFDETILKIDTDLNLVASTNLPSDGKRWNIRYWIQDGFGYVFYQLASSLSIYEARVSKWQLDSNNLPFVQVNDYLLVSEASLTYFDLDIGRGTPSSSPTTPTTTTETTTSGATSSTTTTGTTTPTTTTTTTTTRPPRYAVLEKVETVEVLADGTTKIEQDGSDSKATINTIDSESLELGPIAPGETSITKIIYLRVPASIGIDNIKLSLIDSGGIDFKNTTFGVETLNYLDYNVVPSTFFQGINSEKLPDNVYNFDVPNNGALQSQYVYINVSLPRNHAFGGNTIRYKWFFDYDSGVSATAGSISSTGSGSSGIAQTGSGIGEDVTQISGQSTYTASGFNRSAINGNYYGPVTTNPGLISLLTSNFIKGYYLEGNDPSDAKQPWLCKIGTSTWSNWIIYYYGSPPVYGTVIRSSLLINPLTSNDPDLTPVGQWEYEPDFYPNPAGRVD